MFFQTFNYGPIQDFFVLLRFLAAFLLFYVAVQNGKKIKTGKFLSITTGFTIFLISLGIFNLTGAYQYFYVDYPLYDLIDTIRFIDLSTGIIFLIFFIEVETKLRALNPKTMKFSYTYTITSLIGTGIIFSLYIFKFIEPYLIFIVSCLPLLVVGIKFIKNLKSLEIVRRAKAIPWFLLGLLLAGLSNFILILYNLWTFNINSILIIIGAFMLNYGWSRFPMLSELEWMMKMERLMVIEPESSLMLYQYKFKTLVTQVDDDIAGTVIGGVNMILKEILTTNGHIKEIDYENKRIYFTHGSHSLSILITTVPSIEFKYRLEMFHLSFERMFKKELELEFFEEKSKFKKATNLVNQYFLQ
ncbi:MAG: hypothetical protein ACW986_19250 [Promethearchaeota archaeon]|jgi:hypothetical protein